MIAIDSYTTPWNQQQHVNYIDAQGHIHEVYYDGNAWHHNDLSMLATDFPGAGPRLPANPNAIAGCASAWNQQQHISYIDTAGRINELIYDGSWHHTGFIDLFNPDALHFLGWPAFQGMVTAYPSPWNDQQHIFYVGNLERVYELYLDGHWKGSDLGLQVPGLTISAPIGMHGYTTPWNRQQHIAVISASGGIYELYYAARWTGHVLSADPHPSRIVHNAAIHGHVTTWNEQQHIVYIGANDHINELYYVNGANSWLPNDLTVLATMTNGGVPVGVAGSPSHINVRAINGYPTPWNQQQHVNYVDSLGFINELYYSGNAWRHNSLSALAPGAEAAGYVSGGIAITGYATEWNEQQHVFYIDVNGHINELYYKD